MTYDTKPRNFKAMSNTRLKQELIACDMWLECQADQMTPEEIAVCRANRIAVKNLMRKRGLAEHAD